MIKNNQMIKFQNVSKKFNNGTIALEDINLDISSGEFVFLTGPSGAGKTTLLRLIIKEITPSNGKITIEEKDINKIKKEEIPMFRRKIGVIFQDFKLLPDRTVAENIAIAKEIVGKTKKEIDKDVNEILKVVGLVNQKDLFPSQIAGGEMQRTVIARALIQEPEIILADEPTGNLDPATSWEILDILTNINKLGITIIMATHNTDIVNSLRKRVIRIEKGKIVSDQEKGKYITKGKHD